MEILLLPFIEMKALSYDSVVWTYNSLCENETKFFFEYLYNRVFIKELCDKDNVLIECYNPKIRKNKTLKINFKKSIHHFSKKFIILLKKFIEYKNSIYALYQVRKNIISILIPIQMKIFVT